jgi:hypothetical protein
MIAPIRRAPMAATRKKIWLRRTLQKTSGVLVVAAWLAWSTRRM